MLDKVLDDVGCGAILKNVDTDLKAIIVDFGEQGYPLVCVYRGDEKRNKEPSFKETDYKIMRLLDTKKWIVLTMGQDDYVLVD